VAPFDFIEKYVTAAQAVQYMPTVDMRTRKPLQEQAT